MKFKKNAWLAKNKIFNRGNTFWVACMSFVTLVSFTGRKYHQYVLSALNSHLKYWWCLGEKKESKRWNQNISHWSVRLAKELIMRSRCIFAMVARKNVCIYTVRRIWSMFLKEMQGGIVRTVRDWTLNRKRGEEKGRQDRKDQFEGVPFWKRNIMKSWQIYQLLLLSISTLEMKQDNRNQGAERRENQEENDLNV